MLPSSVVASKITKVITSRLNPLTREVIIDVHYVDEHGNRVRAPHEIAYPPKPHPSKLRENKGGNFCFHNPEKLRVIVENISSKIPSILRDAIERVRDWALNPRKEEYKEFNELLTKGQRLFAPRSERREGLGQLLSIMISLMNLETGRLGFPALKGFFSHTYEKLRERSSLTKYRFEEAKVQAIKAGLLFNEEEQERLCTGYDAKGKRIWKCFPVVKGLSRRFFELLGVDMEEFDFQCERAKAKAEVKWRKNYETAYSIDYITLYRMLRPCSEAYIPTMAEAKEKEKEQQRQANLLDYYLRDEKPPQELLLEPTKTKPKGNVSEDEIWFVRAVRYLADIGGNTRDHDTIKGVAMQLKSGDITV